MNYLLLIAIGGALGALSRYGVFLALDKYYGSGVQFMSFYVNITGSFFAGIFYQLIQQKTSYLYIFLSIGFLGAFTTFSAFSLENLAFIERRAWLESFLYCFSSVGLSLFSAFLGMWLIKAFLT